MLLLAKFRVVISEGSSFQGLVFNRITNVNFQNVILDNISQTQLQLTDIADTAVEMNSKFPNSEVVSNLILEWNNSSGTFQVDEDIRNHINKKIFSLI